MSSFSSHNILNIKSTDDSIFFEDYGLYLVKSGIKAIAPVNSDTIHFFVEGFSSPFQLTLVGRPDINKCLKEIVDAVQKKPSVFGECINFTSSSPNFSFGNNRFPFGSDISNSFIIGKK